MRELDKEGSALLTELDESERHVLAELMAKRMQQQGGGGNGGSGSSGSSSSADNSGLAAVRAKRHKAQHMADEKVSVADQACAECEIHLDRLDTELAR